MRGLVISPEYKVTNEGGIYFKESDIGDIQLRQYLLYWDKLDFPDSNLVSIGETPEIEYLKSVGVLQRTRFNLNSFNGAIYTRMQLDTFRLNNEKKTGSWSIAQPNSDLILTEDSSISSRNLEIELYQCLPIPSSVVSIDDILVFKERRKDELLEFRSLMDNLYLEIVNSGDSERSKLKNIEQLQRKVKEINRVMNESKIENILGNVKVEYDLSDIITKTGIAVLSSILGNYPIGLGFATGLLSAIKIKSEMSLKPKAVPERLKDYAYLYHTHNEFK